MPLDEWYSITNTSNDGPDGWKKRHGQLWRRQILFSNETHYNWLSCAITDQWTFSKRLPKTFHLLTFFLSTQSDYFSIWLCIAEMNGKTVQICNWNDQKRKRGQFISASNLLLLTSNLFLLFFCHFFLPLSSFGQPQRVSSVQIEDYLSFPLLLNWVNGQI